MPRPARPAAPKPAAPRAKAAAVEVPMVTIFVSAAREIDGKVTFLIAQLLYVSSVLLAIHYFLLKFELAAGKYRITLLIFINSYTQ